MSSRLIDLYGQTTIAQKIEGEHWYNQARLFCLVTALKYNLSIETVAAVLSLLSPRNKWERNKTDTEKVIKAHKLGFHYTSIPASTFKKNVKKALNVLDGREPSFGQKTQSFYNCIVNPKTEDVCIDMWAARAVGYEKKVIYAKQYKEIQTKYQKAAKKLGLTPYVLQASIWLKVREDATRLSNTRTK